MEVMAEEQQGRGGGVGGHPLLSLLKP